MGSNSELPFTFTEREEPPRDVFPQEFGHLDGPDWSYMTLSSGTSAVISCASVIERIHSSSSNCFKVGSYSFFKNMTCLLRRNRHFSGKSPVAHFIVSMSSPRNRRLLCPAPAKDTMASKWSCRSPVRPGGAARYLFPCGLALSWHLALPCTFHHPKQPALPRHTLHCEMSSVARAPWNQGCSPVLSTICGTLRCSTHESFHGFADGSSGCQGASSFATLFVRLWLRYSCSPAKRTRVLLHQNLCNKLTDCLCFLAP